MKKTEKFADGLVWNYVSTLFLAAGGFLFSIIIAVFYDEEVLGVFNQIFAYYILLSQLAVFGVHLALTRYSALATENLADGSRLLLSALCSAAVTSTLTLFVMGTIYSLLRNHMPGTALSYIWLVFTALPLFSFNKVMLGYLNGLAKMKAYAVFQAARNVLIAIFIIIIALMHGPGEYLAVSFFLTELVLFVVMLGYLAHHQLVGLGPTRRWIKELLQFGFWILPGNFVLELNSKVDILCLSVLGISDGLIGYYSFAALFMEGLYQMLVVIRRSINPQLTCCFDKARTDIKERFAKYRKGITKLIYFIGVSAAAAVIAGYFALCLMINRKDYLMAIGALSVVAVSIALTAKYIAFGNLLAQTGAPAKESLVNIISVCSNIILNLIFISIWGIFGAGFATACSYIVYAVVLKQFVKHELKVDL